MQSKGIISYYFITDSRFYILDKFIIFYLQNLKNSTESKINLTKSKINLIFRRQTMTKGKKLKFYI